MSAGPLQEPCKNASGAALSASLGACRYSSREALENRLLLAIENAEGFGLR